MSSNYEDPSFGQVMRWIIGGIVTLTIVSCGLAWIVQGNDFFLYKVFAPQQEAVRRQVFENTPSFVNGSIQDLQDLQRDYLKADDDDHKKALAGMIIDRSANVPEDRLPVSLKAFIWQLKKDRGMN